MTKDNSIVNKSKLNKETTNILEFLNNMPGMYFAYTVHNNCLQILYYTKNMSDLLGSEGKNGEKLPDFLSHIFPDDLDNVKTLLESSSNIKEIVSTFRIINAQGEHIFAKLYAKKYVTIDDADIFVANIIEIPKDLDGCLSMLEASDRCICLIDKTTKTLLYGNEAFFALTGVDSKTAIGKNCCDVICKNPEMKDNPLCTCFSVVNSEDVKEIYNPVTKQTISIFGANIKGGVDGAYAFYLENITEAKRMNDDLLDFQKRFELVLENSSLMVWEYDMINHRCINSEKAGKSYNIPIVIENYPESLFLTKFVPPETVDQILEVKERLENGESGFSVERRTIDNDGESHWQRIIYTLELDENGKPARAFACGLDITEEKILKEKYNEQMEYRNRLASNAAVTAHLDLISNQLLDYTSNVNELNELVSTIFTADEFFAKFFHTSVFEQDSTITHDLLNRTTLEYSFNQGQKQYNTVYRCSFLDRYFDLSLVLDKNPGNGHLELFVVLRDVTYGERTRKAFRLVADKLIDSIAIIDMEPKTFYFVSNIKNNALVKKTQKQPLNYNAYITDALKFNQEAFFSEKDYKEATEALSLDKVYENLQKSSYYEFMIKTKTKEGKTKVYKLTYTYSGNADKHVVLSVMNITQSVETEQIRQRELEMALSAANQANEAKTNFLSKISHDMRTPMNGIIGMTWLTQEIPNLPEEVRKNLASISESSNFLLQLINDVLDLNKIESNKMELNVERVNAKELLEDIKNMVMPLVIKKGIKLVVHNEGINIGDFYCDKIRLQQVFINVLSNAIKFTSMGGTIILTFAVLEKNKDKVKVCCSIKDNGCGMSKEFQEHIFDAFVQENIVANYSNEGSGLGMSIVKKIVELMGGTINVESTQDVGTNVILNLEFKCVPDNIPAPKEKRIYNLAVLKGKRILLAEDHPLNTVIARKVLEKKGMVVDNAHNGEQAIEMFKKSPEFFYDLILMDIRMPGIDGIEATKIIRTLERKDSRSIPIVAMTANVFREDIEKCLQAGMNKHIGKPINAELTYEVLASFFSKE